MAVVEQVSHRVAVMYLGEIVEMGPSAAVFGTPRHSYTKRLLGAVPVPDPALGRRLRIDEAREIRSPMRPVGDMRSSAPLAEVAVGHFVRPEAA
jgi:ABC-type oligopeptide transport system ATPase subunit